MGGDHSQGPSMAESGLGEENRRVLGWIAELMNGSSREAALLELSKKREQVPELALILWHSFGDLSLSRFASVTYVANFILLRCHDIVASRDHLCLPAAKPLSAHCCCI